MDASPTYDELRQRVTELERKLKDKTAVIGVVGLGYVGLPLAVAFAQAGFFSF